MLYWFLSLESFIFLKKERTKTENTGFFFCFFFTRQPYVHDIKEKETSKDRRYYGLLKGTRAGHTEILLF